MWVSMYIFVHHVTILMIMVDGFNLFEIDACFY